MTTQPLSDVQATRFENIKLALGNDELLLMSVLFDGKPRACVCIATYDADDYFNVFPVALMLEDEDMDLLADDDGMKPEVINEAQ